MPASGPDSPRWHQIAHFAGVVRYCVEHFLAKTKDELPSAFVSLCTASSSAFIAREMFVAPADGDSSTASPRGTRGVAKRGTPTLGAQFRSQLDALMATLGACAPHFVRCIKPNAAKVAAPCFDAPMVLGQMRCAGLLEARGVYAWVPASHV